MRVVELEGSKGELVLSKRKIITTGPWLCAEIHSAGGNGQIYHIDKFSCLSNHQNFYWLGIAPQNVELFCWFARTGRLIIAPFQKKILCNCCDNKVAEESYYNHLLLRCDWSWKVWSFCLKGWGFDWVCPEKFDDHARWWFDAGGKADGLTDFWFVSFFAIAWTIWWARNEMIFKKNKKLISIEEVAKLASSTAAFWLKAFDKEIELSVEDLVYRMESSLVCLKSRHCKPKVGKPKHVVWLPPRKGALKFNVDGSARGKPGPAGIGGVLRNDVGEVLCIFSNSIGYFDSNVAEVLAIKEALEVFCSSIWVARPLVIESDSIIALSWITKKESRPLELMGVLTAVDYLCSYIAVEFCHTLREGNAMADMYAKQGVDQQQRFVAWSCRDHVAREGRSITNGCCCWEM